jgi:hypothetical protein
MVATLLNRGASVMERGYGADLWQWFTRRACAAHLVKRRCTLLHSMDLL